MTEFSLARKLYPEFCAEAEQGYSYGPSSYQPIIDHLGRVAVQVDDSDYQGDTRVLYHESNGQIGWMQFDWGSCSGCDALQACNSIKSLDDLITSFHPKWFEDKDEALKFFETHDWEGDYSFHQAEQKQFVEKSKDYLRNLK